MLLLLGISSADYAKGRIKYISNRADTIQIDIKDKGPVAVRFDAKTKFEIAKRIKELRLTAGIGADDSGLMRNANTDPSTGGTGMRAYIVTFVKET